VAFSTRLDDRVIHYYTLWHRWRHPRRHLRFVSRPPCAGLPAGVSSWQQRECVNTVRLAYHCCSVRLLVADEKGPMTADAPPKSLSLSLYPLMPHNRVMTVACFGTSVGNGT
jgi:hypothetical protein